jgi:ferrous iron transport protein B
LNGLYSQSAAREHCATAEGGCVREEYEAAKTSELSGRNELRRHFSKGLHQAFAYLLFVLLYVPCVGATAVVFKEIGRFYGAIFVGYMTLLGWSVATIYHSAMVSGDLLWGGIGVTLIVAMFGAFAIYGRTHRVDLR